MRAQSILPFHENKFDALKHSRLGNWRGTNSHWKNSNPISGCCSYVCWCGKYGRPGRCTRFSSLPWWVVYFLPCWQYPPMLQLLYYSYFKIMSLNNAVFGILHKGAAGMNKVCGCYSVSFLVLHLLLIKIKSWCFCCISKSMMKHQQKLYWISVLLWFTYGYWKWMCVDSLNEYIDPPIVVTIEYRVVNNIWRHSWIFFKHVSLWGLFLDPHLTTHHSITGVQWSQVTD